MKPYEALLSCLTALHAPGGGELLIDLDQVFAIRPSAGFSAEHVAKGTNTILYIDGRAFGVVETAAEITALINRCRGKTQ